MADDDTKPSTALAELGLEAPLCQLSKPNVDEWTVRRMWEGIQRRRAARPFRAKARSSTVLISALATLGLSLAVFSLWAGEGLFESNERAASSLATGPLLTREARPFAGLETPVHDATSPSPAAASTTTRARVDFADGSSIEAVAGTRVDALASTGEEFAVRVRRGRAQFRVTPGGPRRWRIEAGAVSVEVLGTVLWVERDDVDIRVQVETGRVLVRSPELPGGVQSVVAGQSLRLPEQRARSSSGQGGIQDASALAAPGATAASDAPDAPPAATRAPAAPDGGAAGVGPARLEGPLANARHAPAVRQGPTPAAELWESVDDARRRGQSLRAVELLKRLLRDYPGDSQVALAAFTLGVLQLERRAQPAEAALSFQRALELGIGAALREDVYLRWAEALARAGTPARIDALLAEYLSRYPRGRQRANIERLRGREGAAPATLPNRAEPPPRQPAAKKSGAPDANPPPSGAAP